MRIITLLGLLLTVFNSSASDYRLDHSDISVSLNLSMIENAIGRISNTYYSGKYVHGGMICSSPRLTVNTTTFDIRTNGYLSGNLGKTTLESTGIAGMKAKLTRCSTWSAGVACRVENKLKDLTKKSRLGGICIAEFGRIRAPFFIGAEIKPVVKKPPIFPVKLNNSDNLIFEFGTWDGSEWEVSDTPNEKTVSYQPKLGLKTTGTIPSSGKIRGEVLSMEAGIGRSFFTSTGDRTKYRNYYLHENGFDKNNDILQLVIDQSLFLKKDSSGLASGIFGEIFPIRVNGDVGNQNLDVILEGASIKYATFEDEKVIVIGAKVTSLSTGAFIENAEALIMLSQPAFESNELVTYIKSFELNMETKCLAFSFCLNESLLPYLVDNRLIIAELDGVVELEIPNCIQMDSNRWEPDGSKCPDGTLGRRGNSPKSTRLTPLLDQAKINISEYAMQINIPVKEEVYNPKNTIIMNRLNRADIEKADNIIIPEKDFTPGTEEEY